MAIRKYHDAAGRECKVFWPPETLSEAEQNYHDCNCDCQLCREEIPMNDRIGREDIVRFSSGREATGQELAKNHAGRRLVDFAKRHMARHGGTFQEALSIVRRLSPEIVRTYLSLQLPRGTSGSYNYPKSGGKEIADFWFRERAGWTETGVRDWIKQQGFTGGELARNEGGWAYTLHPDTEKFPR